MAGITNREREDKARIAEIKLKLFKPMPLYLYQKLNASLTALQRVQDNRVEKRKAELAAKRAAAAEAAPKPHLNVLPWNHRGPDPNAPPAPVAPPPDAGWPDLSYQGKGQ